MIIDAAHVPPQPWKNGGGVTRELLRWPAEDAGGDAGHWRLRLSVADIAADGPFSAFPGVVRWFAVLAGEGVVLSLPDGERTLRPGDPPLRFDGAAAPGCRLLAGPTVDLNLMLQGLDGELRPACKGDTPPAWPQVGFFEAVARRLHWPATGPAPANGFWIGVAA